MSETRAVDLPDLEHLTDEPPVVHLFPRDPRYRLSGSIPLPQPGDIALCGVTRKAPGDPKWLGHEATCVRCVRLSRMAGR